MDSIASILDGPNLKNAYEILKSLLDSDRNVMLVRVDASGTIMDGNAMLASVAGLEREALCGENLLDYMERDFLPLIPDILATVWAGGPPVVYNVHLLGPGQIHCPLACRFFASDDSIVLLGGIDVEQLQGMYDDLAVTSQELSDMIEVQRRGREIAEANVRNLEREVARRKTAELRLGEIKDSLESQIAERTRDLVARTEALRQSERRIADFANISADFFFETDADLRYTYVSATVTGSGRSTSEIIGRTRAEVCQLFRGEAVDDEEIQAQRERRSYRNLERRSDLVRERWLRVSGEPKYSDDGAFLGYIGINSEITEFKQQQEALANSEANFRRLVEDSRLGIHILDKGKIVFANAAQVELFGYDSLEEILALDNVMDLSVPQERERLEEYLHKRLNGEEAPDDYTVEGLRKDGSTFPLQLSIQHVQWEGRRLVANTLVDLNAQANKVVESPRLR